jgi:hypothetical protein
MLMSILLLSALAPSHAVPQCHAAQLRLTADDHGGGYNGMSHSGTELLIRNIGRPCMLAAKPALDMRDARGRVVARGDASQSRGAPVRLGTGRRGSIELRWVSNGVFEHNRNVHARFIVMRIGSGSLRAPIDATLYGEAGSGFAFEQTAAHHPEAPPHP